MIEGTVSPDDPDLKEYWQRRANARTRDFFPGKQRLARSQALKCSVCDEFLLNREALHAHHQIPKSEGGKDVFNNLELLHAECHQQKHTGMSR